MLNGKLFQFRKLEKGEVIFVGGDCAQGGIDSNISQFLSRTKLDVPFVYENKGVASQMTPDLYEILCKIYDVTGVKPWLCLERNMGGTSELERLKVLLENSSVKKFHIWAPPPLGNNKKKEVEGTRLGIDTTGKTRPILVGDLNLAIETKALKIYESKTIEQLQSFIINPRGKPEAESGAHDDRVIALAIVWYMFKRLVPIEAETADYSKYEDVQQEVSYNPLG